MAKFLKAMQGTVWVRLGDGAEKGLGMGEVFPVPDTVDKGYLERLLGSKAVVECDADGTVAGAPVAVAAPVAAKGKDKKGKALERDE